MKKKLTILYSQGVAELYGYGTKFTDISGITINKNFKDPHKESLKENFNSSFGTHTIYPILIGKKIDGGVFL